jgi:hypothetical protein
MPIKILYKIHDTKTACYGKSGISHKTCHYMACKPVTLERRDQWLYPAVYIGRQGSKGHGKKCNGNNEYAQAFVFDPPLENQIEKNDGPCKKNQRFIEIGEGCMTDSHSVGFHPSKDERCCLRRKTNKCCNGRQTAPDILTPDHPDKVKNKGCKIDEGNPAENGGIDHEFDTPELCMSSIRLAVSRSRQTGSLLVLPAMLILVFGPCLSILIQTCRWE